MISFILRSRLLIVVLFLLPFLASPIAAQDETTAQTYLEEGIELSEDGNYEQAIDVFTQAIELDATFVDAYLERGKAYQELNEFDKAIHDYTYAIELDPGSSKAYEYRGNAYRTLSQFTKAIDNYTRAIELDLTNVDAYFNRGLSYSELKRNEQAIADFTQVLELQPENADAYLSRGLTYKEDQQYDKAVEDLTHVIELETYPTKAHLRRGLIYLMMGNQDEDKAEEYSDLALTDFCEFKRLLEYNYVWGEDMVNMLLADINRPCPVDDLSEVYQFAGTSVVFHYPAGWSVNVPDQDGNVSLTDNMTMFFFFYNPAAIAAEANPPIDDVETALQLFMSKIPSLGIIQHEDEASEIQLAGRRALQLKFKTNSFEGVAIVTEFSNGEVGIVLVGAFHGLALTDIEETAMKIVATFDVQEGIDE